MADIGGGTGVSAGSMGRNAGGAIAGAGMAARGGTGIGIGIGMAQPLIKSAEAARHESETFLLAKM
jgi:hypothetical protein